MLSSRKCTAYTYRASLKHDARFMPFLLSVRDSIYPQMLCWVLIVLTDMFEYNCKTALSLASIVCPMY